MSESPGPLYVRSREPLTKAEAGRIGAAKRWGPRRTIRLTDLDPITANIIRTILAARENAAADPPTAA